MRSNRRHRPLLPLLFLALAFLAFVAMGAVQRRRNFETRGIEGGLPPPIAHGGVKLGINVALEQYEADALDQTLAQIADANVEAIKQSFYHEDDFDWEQSTRIMRVAERHGLQVVPLLDGNPARNFAPPDDPEQFARWAGEFARRYGEQVRYYMVWDEPNLSSHWGNEPVNAYEYGALLSAAAEEIRNADADAVIVAAPLAPTTETGPDNLADPLFLDMLYSAGAGVAFDVVAAKPYGFYSGPDDRVVDLDTLNFSRAILLREVMHRHGDEHKALFAGNWGWNSLPVTWEGAPSIWGQVDQQTQVDYTLAALERARREWPWMGYMFLENWEPAAPADDPRWGFSVAGRSLQTALVDHIGVTEVAYPGFHLARVDGAGQSYDGGWRFSPAYGADISESGDRAILRFWGTDAGLRIRRANYRARLYVTVDGERANALPDDGEGAALVLTSPTENDDFLTTELVVRDLSPGEHTMTITAYRGWDQWALNGYSVGYQPPATTYRLTMLALLLMGSFFTILALSTGRRADWGAAGRTLRRLYTTAGQQTQLALTVAAAALVALTGWLTWGEQAAGVYRRLGDVSQLAATATFASLYYATPFFFLYLGALAILFLLVYARPAWGLALVAFTFPFYVVPKPMLGYRFSPVEVFVLVTAAAAGAAFLTRFTGRVRAGAREESVTRLQASQRQLERAVSSVREALSSADLAVLVFVGVATLSLLFTERLDVAENEWRVVIVEPALFYFLVRALRPTRREMWFILDAFVLGGLVVALYGLVTFATGQNVITVDGGLGRLHSIYGSPNNVALYLGRQVPLLLAMLLGGNETPRRRLFYGVALLPMGLAIALTLSKGALFLGLPAAFVIVLLLWLRSRQQAVWPWIGAGALLLIGGLLVALNHPALSGRLSVQGATSIARLNLWRASVTMVAEHPFFGVGLDNFLYAYRSRYILDAAWAEPDLNHPHNIVLDFATRLGLFGLVTGSWLIWALARRLPRLLATVRSAWRPVTVGLAGALAQMLAHGLVDHSFFLVDLAFAFFLMLALTIWLQENGFPEEHASRDRERATIESKTVT